MKTKPTIQRSYQRPAARGGVDLRLDANESVAPTASELGDFDPLVPELLSRYPDATALTEALATYLDVDAERVLVTAGADEGIDRLCRRFLGRGRDLLVPTPTFEMFERYATLAGADVRSVEWTDGDPLDELLALDDEAVGMIAVVSPNNPTGQVVDPAAFQRVLERRRPDRAVVLDAVYVDYADAPMRELFRSALACEGVFVLQSFSKAFGLAGLRVGSVIGPPEEIASLRSMGGPYAVSAWSMEVARRVLEAPALAAAQQRWQLVREQRARIDKALERGLAADVSPSQANFSFARTSRAAFVDDALQSQGIAVRVWRDRPERHDWLRVTTPTTVGETDRVLEALELALNPEALLLDMDGVLVDVGGSYRVCIARTVESFGGRCDALDIEMAKAKGGANNDWVVSQRILAAQDLPVELDAVIERFESFYRGGLWQEERALIAAQELAALADELPLGLVTGRPRRDAEEALERFGWQGLFGSVVCMEDAPAKPSPAPLERAKRELGIRRAWMVGDTVDDARAARAAGCLAIGVLAPGTTRECWQPLLEEAGCARVLTSVTELRDRKEWS